MSRRTELAAVFGGSALAYGVAMLLHWHVLAKSLGGDAYYYFVMAQHPSHFTTAPYGYRILVPFFVWLLHTPEKATFAVITVIALAVTTLLLYVYLLRFCNRSSALVGVALFGFSPAVVYGIQSPILVDPVVYMLFMAGLLALVDERWILFGAVLTIGVFSQEHFLFMIGVAAVIGFVNYRLHPARRWTVLIGLPIAVYMALHYTPLVFSSRTNWSPFSRSSFSFILHYQDRFGGPAKTLASAILGTFGPLWVAAAVFFTWADRRIQQTTVLLVLVAGSLAIDTDWPRMLAYAFPVVIPLVCAGLRALSPAAVGILSASYAALVLLVINLPQSTTTKYVIEGVVLALGLLAVASGAMTWEGGRIRFRSPHPMPPVR